MLLAQASFGLLRNGHRTLRPVHIALGFLLLPLILAHAWLSMNAQTMRTANAIGIWLATAALLMLALQLFLGTELIRSASSRSSRKIHLAIGLAVLSLVGIHLWLIK